MTTSSPPIYNGRYELSHQIARGGTAQVYLARDLRLDRPVALKVLFPELSNDPSFVERFRREAQAAANLSHPNIVPVFDWGESERTYFIVMEFVDGQPLSSIIRERGPLPAREAAEIGSAIAKALSYAHRHGVVHRDIKPGNVLITGDGVVKVTDFGIARAIGSDENVTQTGLVMGTATYFSPEQAQGLSVDGRSDVYSLGVVCYEMVTGRPPFSGETPVSIAYQHVREEAPRPRSIEPGIPAPFEAIVLHAMEKSPAQRYATAQELGADLDRFHRGAPVLAPMPFGDDQAEDGDTGLVTATALLAAGALGATAVQPTASGHTAPAPTAVLAGGAPGAPADDRGNGRGGGSTTKDQLPKRRTASAALVTLFLLLALGAVVYFGGRGLGYFGGAKSFQVPDVTTLQLSAAASTLHRHGLHDTVDRVHNQASVGTVIDQSPRPPATVQRGATVRLTVSTGPKVVSVPYLIGDSYSTAASQLRADGLKVRRTYVAVPSGQVPPAFDTVTAQHPSSGSRIPPGRTVTLDVERGVADLKIPTSVEGATITAATSTLVDLGFNVANQSSYATSKTVPSGDVINTSPAAGTKQPRGSTVTLIVSEGPPTAMPNLIGDTPQQAAQTLAADGFSPPTVVYETAPNSADDGLVFNQTPAPSTSVPTSAPVTIDVGTTPTTTTTTTTTTTSTTTTTTSTTPTSPTSPTTPTSPPGPNGGTRAKGASGGGSKANEAPSGRRRPTTARS
jgi:beta-lactam-binding protein with PASTA domain/predicted Ser/Thr protein kinase